MYTMFYEPLKDKYHTDFC